MGTYNASCDRWPEETTTTDMRSWEAAAWKSDRKTGRAREREMGELAWEDGDMGSQEEEEAGARGRGVAFTWSVDHGHMATQLVHPPWKKHNYCHSLFSHPHPISSHLFQSTPSRRSLAIPTTYLSLPMAVTDQSSTPASTYRSIESLSPALHDYWWWSITFSFFSPGDFGRFVNLGGHIDLSIYLNDWCPGWIT